MSLIPNAFADSNAITNLFGSSSNLMSFLPMVVIFVLFWLLLIRPQQKKMKLHNAMLSSLDKGEEVITNGGVVGKITKLEDNFIYLEIASGVEAKFQRSAITGKLNKDVAKVK